jgi:cell cycle checkpoint protein
MHSLPSPVARRGQKQFKPAFFEALKKEREAADAVASVQEWLHADVRPACGRGWAGADWSTGRRAARGRVEEDQHCA